MTPLISSSGRFSTSFDLQMISLSKSSSGRTSKIKELDYKIRLECYISAKNRIK